MIKSPHSSSSSNTATTTTTNVQGEQQQQQQRRLPRSEQQGNGNGNVTTTGMDTLKTTFLPNLSMDGGGGVLATAHYCPMCGQQFERPQHAAQHMQLCHGIITGGGLLMAQQHQLHQGPNNSATDPSIDYPCLSCDDKFPTAQELDEHHRLIHQAAFLARCLTCGIYGISSAALQDGDEYKCMHCGSICTAATLAAGQPSYMDQHDAPQTPEEMTAITPEDINPIGGDEQQQQQQHLHQQSIEQQRVQHQHQQQQQQQQHHHLHQQQQQQQHQQQQQTDVQLKVPPLTVKLNKNANGGIEGHPQVVIKQEPLCMSDSGDGTPTSIPVYTIQQPIAVAPSSNTTSVVVSTASATAAAVAAARIAAMDSSTIITTTMVGNKVRHKCPECPRTFKTPGTLAMHRKVHTGEADATPKERPYTCSYCGKSFTQSNTLKQHTRIHTGEKPYHCGYCEKSFSVKDYLTKHIRTHTGEKPYTCLYCDKRFTQRSALTVHTTKLHPL